VDKVIESSVFCYGEIGVDNIIQAKRLPTPEIAVFPKAESYHIGGAAANTAVWLAHLGIETGLSGNLSAMINMAAIWSNGYPGTRTLISAI
jgi:sugar/nucleoside kinase (ribokinase family)